MIIKNLFKKIATFKKENPKEFWILVAILLVGAFLRLYRISEYMTFLGDEGRDAIVIRRLLVDFDPILVGPGTSIGNMYLGPLYYYLIAPSFLLSFLSPVGPSVFVALLGILTIYFVWFVVREWFPSKDQNKINIGAAIAAALYAVSPTLIIFSRSSWNPNVMPFFALLTIYSLWRVWQKQQFRWLITLAISFAFVLQSHYLGLLLSPTIAIFWLLSFLKVRKTKAIKGFVKNNIWTLLIFLFLMSPLVIFDARHGWRNFDAIRVFFLERQTTVSARPWNALPNIWPLLQNVSTRLLAGRVEVAGLLVAIGVIVFSIKTAFTFGKKKRISQGAYILLFTWLAFAFIGLGVYKQEIYDHYYGFFFAAPFILIGGFAQGFANTKYGPKLLGSVGLLLILVNLTNSPIINPPNRQLQRSVAVAQKIQEESGGEKFNLAVIAERNYEAAYQYYLEKWNTKVTDIDPVDTDNTITDQLFVVCELPKEECDPTHNPKAEVANFGWTVIDSEWEVFGVTIFKLVHSQ